MSGLASAAAGFIQVCVLIRRVLWLVAGLGGGLGGFSCAGHAATPVTPHLYEAEAACAAGTPLTPRRVLILLLYVC